MGPANAAGVLGALFAQPVGGFGSDETLQKLPALRKCDAIGRANLWRLRG
ncbi:hypothetical protein [Ferrithrix thermotolerans]|nr:hypothetical protein [Ferrithrix thermotolerans]